MKLAGKCLNLGNSKGSNPGSDRMFSLIHRSLPQLHMCVQEEGSRSENSKRLRAGKEDKRTTWKDEHWGKGQRGNRRGREGRDGTVKSNEVWMISPYGNLLLCKLI